VSEGAEVLQLPAEVLAFLRDVPAQPFCPLTPEAAARRSAKLQQRHPLAAELGLVRLNDPKNSDFYAYVTRGPAAGVVLFLPHDDGLSFAFPSLTSLGEALRVAAAAGTDIEDLQPVGSAASVVDQPAVRGRVRAALAGDDAANALAAYLPLLADDDVETLGLAATDGDFLVREVAAKRMARAPHAAQVPLLEALCGDRYGQVWKRARDAFAALGIEGPPLSEEHAFEIDTGERGTTGVVISMVTRNTGAALLVMDDARRAGDAPPYQWNAEGHAETVRFDLTALVEHEIDRKDLAELARSVIARLALHHETGGKPRR
jgi:hypothetical protein